MNMTLLDKYAFRLFQGFVIVCTSIIPKYSFYNIQQCVAMKTLNTVIHFSSKHIYIETELYYISILNPAHARAVASLFPVFWDWFGNFQSTAWDWKLRPSQTHKTNLLSFLFSVELWRLYVSACRWKLIMSFDLSFMGEDFSSYLSQANQTWRENVF